MTVLISPGTAGSSGRISRTPPSQRSRYFPSGSLAKPALRLSFSSSALQNTVSFSRYGVRTGTAAVAALVAHPVDVQHLFSAVRLYDHVCPVGADRGAAAADGAAVRVCFGLLRAWCPAGRMPVPRPGAQAFGQPVQHGMLRPDPGCPAPFQRGRHVVQLFIAARLQQLRAYRDGEQPCPVQQRDDFRIRPSAVGDGKRSVKVPAESGGDVQAERQQRAAAHVHVLVRQLALSGFYGEGVRQLDAEEKTQRLCPVPDAAQHGDGLPVPQIAVKGFVLELDVIKAQRIQRPAGVTVAHQSGVAFDVQVQLFVLQQVLCDFLDLPGGTAVHGGDGHAAADGGRDGVQILSAEVPEVCEALCQHCPAVPEFLRPGGVLHVFQKVVDLPAPDPGQIVAHAHVEYKAVRPAQLQLPGQHMDQEPCLDVLVLRLGYRQLRGPFAVIALVLGQDTGL